MHYATGDSGIVVLSVSANIDRRRSDTESTPFDLIDYSDITFLYLGTDKSFDTVIQLVRY